MNCPFELPYGEAGIEFDEESEKHGPGGQKRTKSVRFGSIRFGSVRFDSYNSDMEVVQDCAHQPCN